MKHQHRWRDLAISSMDVSWRQSLPLPHLHKIQEIRGCCKADCRACCHSAPSGWTNCGKIWIGVGWWWGGGRNPLWLKKRKRICTNIWIWTEKKCKFSFSHWCFTTKLLYSVFMFSSRTTINNQFVTCFILIVHCIRWKNFRHKNV